MEQKEKDFFDGIYANLSSDSLGTSIESVRSFLDAHPYLMHGEELDGIERDYHLMLDYMRRGFNDSQRDAIYRRLSKRLRNCVDNLQRAYKIHALPFFAEASRRAGGQPLSFGQIRSKLEGFVADIAMLSLEMEEVRLVKSKETYHRHTDFMQTLFNSIIVSKPWTDDDVRFYTELILSPTIDTNDAQMIVSAMMLAAMNCVDANKLRVLLSVYKNATDEKVRQKALVGWTFALSNEWTNDEDRREIIDEALENELMVSDLTDLQKQIVFCMNAEKDKDTIQRDIIPELMKNNNIRITRFGISEKEEDPMADVLDPEASDRAMEKMEESFQKMINMQKAGSDIYFGGFSQMKRFPFFNNVTNWFCPFYIEHPDIEKAADKLKDTPMLTSILNSGPFCDSDKYSFTLALSSVISHLPANMRELLNSKEVLGHHVSDEEMKTPAYIRRMVLQDLYRFFRLFTQREQLINPFSKENFVFVANKIFMGTPIEKSYQELCSFMLRQKNKDALDRIMPVYNDVDNAKCLLIHGMYELYYTKDVALAESYLKRFVEREPDNKRGLSLLARACFDTENYLVAAECYEKMLRLAPDSKNVTLNFCIALAKAKEYEKAVGLLYKMDFENPETASVIRVLAWTLMGQGKLEQAENEYSRLLENSEVETGDWLNAGYCLWLKGDTQNAIKMFVEFKKQNGKTDGEDPFLTAVSCTDHQFLREHKISEMEIKLMTDIVRKENQEN